MFKPFYTLVISISVYSCSETSVKTSPQDVIKKYERFVLEMKADSIAQLFTTDAEIGHEDQSPVRGRDSIYSFLSSFKNVRVVDNHDQVVSSSIRDDSAIMIHFRYAVKDFEKFIDDWGQFLKINPDDHFLSLPSILGTGYFYGKIINDAMSDRKSVV